MMEVRIYRLRTVYSCGLLDLARRRYNGLVRQIANSYLREQGCGEASNYDEFLACIGLFQEKSQEGIERGIADLLTLWDCPIDLSPGECWRMIQRNRGRKRWEVDRRHKDALRFVAEFLPDWVWEIGGCDEQSC